MKSISEFLERLIGFCNFNCSYCFDRGKNVFFIPSKKDVNTLLKNVFSLDYNTFEFVILGGEPTYYPYIEYALEQILSNKKVSRVIVVTNGSNILKMKTLAALDSKRLKFSVSLHPEGKVDVIRLSEIPNTYFSLMFLPKYEKKLLL